MEFKSSCEIRKGIGRVIKISMSMNFPFNGDFGKEKYIYEMVDKLHSFMFL